MACYRFSLQLDPHETHDPALARWIETLTGHPVTLKFTRQWNHSWRCELDLQTTRDQAIGFYNLMLQHHRIESLQTI